MEQPVQGSTARPSYEVADLRGAQADGCSRNVRNRKELFSEEWTEADCFING
jgi:hypothetical protein